MTDIGIVTLIMRSQAAYEGITLQSIAQSRQHSYPWRYHL